MWTEKTTNPTDKRKFADLFVSSFYVCFDCVLKGVFVVVYCVWYVLCCCLHGVIKHDDDDDKGSRHFASVSTTLYCRPTSRYTNISPASNFYYRPTTLCLKKVPTFQLSVTLSNVKRFSKFLHCLKAYEICYKTIRHYPPHLRRVAAVPWEIKNANYLQIFSTIEHIWKKMQSNTNIEL